VSTLVRCVIYCTVQCVSCETALSVVLNSCGSRGARHIWPWHHRRHHKASPDHHRKSCCTSRCDAYCRLRLSLAHTTWGVSCRVLRGVVEMKFQPRHDLLCQEGVVRLGTIVVVCRHSCRYSVLLIGTGDVPLLPDLSLVPRYS
jgi:hypothetical protein